MEWTDIRRCCFLALLGLVVGFSLIAVGGADNHVEALAWSAATPVVVYAVVLSGDRGLLAVAITAFVVSVGVHDEPWNDLVGFLWMLLVVGLVARLFMATRTTAAR